MRIAIGGDHGTLEYKARITQLLESKGHIVQDFGTFSNESCDYADFAYLAAKSVSNKENDRAIVICSTGIGVSISANKVDGIRCALVTSLKQAQLTREHNNTNALALGVINNDLATTLEIVSIWIDTDFSNDERHVRRISKIDALDKDYYLLHANTFVVGGSLRNPNYFEENNMAFYTTKDVKGVVENRQRLYQYLQLPLSQGTFITQTHSNHVVEITKDLVGSGAMTMESEIPDCDALFTFEKDVVLNVFHADCVPVWMFDPNTNAIAIAHSSELATAKELVITLVKTLAIRGVNISDLQCYIGAGKSFTNLATTDLATVIYNQLTKLGVNSIHQVAVHTDTNNQYFSATLNDSGRHLAFIYRR